MTEVPEETVEEAERLTRLAREAVDENEAAAYRERRADMLDDHGFTARVREDDPGETLVVHPDEWLEDGVVRTDRIEDIDRAVEVQLSGPGDPDEWDAVDERNREVVETVAALYGPVHGENASALADFMSNHCAKPIDDATSAELTEFIEEYFPRNVWPSDEQAAVVEESVEFAVEATEARTSED